jgi:hypothetical protein
MNPYDTGRPAQVADLDQVASHTDVARIVEQMLEDLHAHPNEWENATLDRYLEALAALLAALPRAYIHHGEPFPEQPTWKLLAEALVAASGYE